jgi:hypothetical protein
VDVIEGRSSWGIESTVSEALRSVEGQMCASVLSVLKSVDGCSVYMDTCFQGSTIECVSPKSVYIQSASQNQSRSDRVYLFLQKNVLLIY